MTWWQNDPSTWTREQLDDIKEVVKRITRDADGLDYEIILSLHSLGRTAYEEGEDQVGVWFRRVEFGLSAADVAGGPSFVMTARAQEEVADTIMRGVWGS